MNFFYIEEDNDLVSIRINSQKIAIDHLNKKKSIHLESEIGSGRFGFLYSITKSVEKRNFLRVDMSDVISKQQLEDSVIKDIGSDIVGVMEYAVSLKETIFLIFDNITNKTNQETLNFLRNLPSTLQGFDNNLFFIFTSASRINQFDDISIKLTPLTIYETKTLISLKLPKKSISNNDTQKLYEKSEGLFTKIETIIKYLSGASCQEVIDSNDIFDNLMTLDNISNTVLQNINNFKEDPKNIETYNLMKILSILKNGESITTIMKAKIGKKITIKNSMQIVDAGLAKSIDIDQTTTILKLNPLVKDFIYKSLEDNEKKKISNEYLDLMIEKKKNSIYISTTNRKIIENGYSTDGDNIVELLFNKIDEIKSMDDCEKKNTLLNAAIYSSRSYIYSLANSSRYKEIITSLLHLNVIIDDPRFNIENDYYLAKAYRMLGDHESSKIYLDLAIKSGSDSSIFNDIRSEEILLSYRINKDYSLSLAKKTKKELNKNTVAYITAEEILAMDLEGDKKRRALIKLESKARKLGFLTSANNISFELSKEKNYKDRLRSMDLVLSTDNSEYNRCRAFIYKMEAIIINNDVRKINDSDIKSLHHIYNYLFHQKLDILFNKCLDILWEVYEFRKKTDLIIYLYSRSLLIWRLGEDKDSQEKYEMKLKTIGDDNTYNISLMK